MKRAAGALALAAAALASAALWLALATRPYAPMLEATRPAPVYDFFSYYRPNAGYAFGRLRAGALPLWNPNQGLGGPFLATLQTGVLYPPNWLHVALPAQPAFTVLALAHLALAAALAGALARALGAGPLGVATAGLLYAGSLQLWSSVWTPPTLYTAAWAPGVLLAVERAVERPGARRAAALAVVVALQILIGWPFAVAMTAIAAAATGSAALLRAGLRARRFPGAAVWTLGLGVGAGLLLAAPQLVPSVELMRQSTRALGTLDEGTAGLHAPPNDPVDFAHQLRSRGANDGLPGLASPLLALLAVVAAGPGRGRAAVLLAVGVLALAASFPLHTPVYDWLRRLPVLGDFRFPFRYRLLTTLALAVCAGVGVSRAERRGGARGQALAGALAALAVACALLPLARSLARGGMAFPRQQLAPLAEHADALAILRRPEHRGARSLWSGFGVDKLGERVDLRTLQDLEPLSLGVTSRLMTFLAVGDAGVRRDADGGVRPTLGAPYSGSIALPDDASRAALLDVMAVRFVASEAPPAWLDQRYRRIPEAGDPPFFENPGALPRAYRAARGEPPPADPQAAIEQLLEPRFAGGRAVLLEPLPAEVSAWSDAPDPQAETRIERDEPERVVVRTRGARPAVLVVADAHYPGWQATLDGAPAPLLRANTALRAVVVPAGEHVVEMRYRPRSFRIGLALAAAAAIGLAAASLRQAA